MKKILLLIALLVSALTFAQNNGITYQAVIYSTNGEAIPGIQNPNSPLVNKAICLQFSVIDSNTQTEYQEKVAITTDSFGMVNLVIGNGTQSGGYASSFNAIAWSNSKKYLKVSVDQSGNCNAFEEISNQLLTYVPFALAADSAASVSGIVGIANGGTNATTVVGAKTNLQLQNVDNTSDINKPLSTATQTALNSKVDKVVGKDLSTNDFTTVEKTKLAEISGVNTGDQDLSSYATLTNLDTKVDKVAGKNLSTEDFTTAEKTKLASLNGTPDLSGYVPFNGAQRALNLGNNNLQANQVTTNNLSVGSVNGMAIGMKGTGETNILGSSSMAYASGGFANTGFGHLTLSETQGDENTALGSQAMRSSTTGSRNTAVGRASLNGNLSGNNNTALGYNTRVSANNLSNTTAIGANAVVGTSNTIQLGDTNVTSVKTSGKLTTGTITLPNTDGTSGQVLSTNGSGVISWTSPSSVNTSNLVDLTTNQFIAGNKIFTSTSIGLQLNTDSYGAKVMKVGFPNNGGNNRNSYKSLTLGVDALKSLLYGDNEIAIGYNALYNDVRGTENIAIGNYSLFTTNYDNITNSWAQNNVVMGNYSGYNMTSGKHNVLMGWQSGYSLNRGSNNTIIGPNASGLGIETGNNNTIIGRALNLPTDLTNNIILANGNTTIGAQFDGTNWTMSGNIKAIGFKTPTGTASGFLKADGSVDTNSYLTSSTANTNLVDLTTNQTIAGNKTLSGITTLSNTTASTSTSNGALIVTGGTGIGGKLNVGGITTVSNSTASTSTTSGAFVVAGGAGIAGNVNVGGNETISGSLGIGTSSVNSSAALEVNSTTQGILFPRVTLAQRDLIASPAKGLVVMCTDCGQTGGELGELQVFNGSRWTNAVGTDASGVSAGINVPAIGSSFQGGKVAYILTPSDPGYESGKVKGIIAATQDLSTSRLRLNNGTYNYSIQNGNSAIGAGLNNTNLLYAAYGTSNTTTSPSYLAYNYSILEGGVTYDDWFIPSKDELYKLYLNKAAIGNFSETGTAEAVYWSSNYCNGNSGAGQYVRFTDGFISCNGTENSYRVRLVRYFTIDGVTSLTADTFNGNLNGNATSATNVSGVVAIANGGTGATTATGAINALLPTQASANGKVLTSDGTNVSWSSPGGNTHYVGESYGGGIVFYTYDNGAHGLIVATSEIGDLGPESSASTTGITFGGNGIWTGAYRYGVGGGLENTNVIISKNSNTGTQYFNYSKTTNTLYAALSASQYLPGGTQSIYYGDWYLPSKGELELLWNNRSSITGSGYNPAHQYWSSTETNDYYAYKMQTNGGVGWTPKVDLCFVLPIRKF